jgi:hypothetical protein
LNVDQEALWEIAKNKMLAQKAQLSAMGGKRSGASAHRKSRVVSKDKKKSLKNELEELENFIKKLEQK